MAIPILYLITELSSGGAQSALLRLLTGLDRSRFSPQVVCFYNGDGIPAQRIRRLDIPVIDLGMHRKYHLDAFYRLYRLIRHTRPVILHTWMFHANITGRLVGRMAGVPILISSRRNVNIGGEGRELINRLTAGMDERVIAVCELARQIEIEKAQVQSDKVVTVYNGIDPAGYPEQSAGVRQAIRQSLGISDSAPVIGSIGRLHRQKGYNYLLEAFQTVCKQQPEVRLVIVGEGELRAILQEQVQQLGLAGKVVFTGQRVDIPELLAGFDLFVLASLWEGFPNVVLEAMAACLPVIATRVGGTPELVLEPQTGLLIPPAEPGKLASAILSVLADLEAAHKMGQNGRGRVEANFTADRMVRRYEEIYTELLNERQSRRTIA